MKKILLKPEQLKTLYALKDTPTFRPAVELYLDGQPLSFSCETDGKTEKYVQKIRSAWDSTPRELVISSFTANITSKEELKAYLQDDGQPFTVVSGECTEIFKVGILGYHYITDYIHNIGAEDQLALADDNSVLVPEPEQNTLAELKGKDRPDLKMAIQSEKTGELEFVSGRFYLDEQAHKLPDDVDKDTMRFFSKEVKVPGSEETKKVPVGKQEADIIRNAMKINDIGKELSNEYELIWETENLSNAPGYGTEQDKMRRLRVYLSYETLKNLVEKVHIRTACAVAGHMQIDVTDAPCVMVTETKGPHREKTIFKVYQRNLIEMFSEMTTQGSYMRPGGGKYLAGGRVYASTAGAGGEYTARALLTGYAALNGVLEKVGYDIFSAKDGTPTRYLIAETDEDGKTVLKEVQPADVPDLACKAIGGFAMNSMKPEDERAAEELFYAEYVYCDEDEEMTQKEAATVSEDDDFSTILQAAQSGDPFAMKLCGKCLEEGVKTGKNEEEALNWYERAKELLQDDENLDFAIFMLKMTMENP